MTVTVTRLYYMYYYFNSNNKNVYPLQHDWRLSEEEKGGTAKKKGGRTSLDDVTTSINQSMKSDYHRDDNRSYLIGGMWKKAT